MFSAASGVSLFLCICYELSRGSFGSKGGSQKPIVMLDWHMDIYDSI
jgi:hypothetical protein